MTQSVSMVCGDAQEFAAFTFSSLAPQLRDVGPPWLAAVAWRDGAPAGLALGRMVEKQRALLDSIRVAAASRREGLGKALLQAFEEEALARDATSLWVRYSETLPGVERFHAFLDACGWEAPVDWLHKFIGKPSELVPLGLAQRGVQRILDNAGLRYDPLRLSGDDEAAVTRLLAQPAAELFAHPLELLSRYRPPAEALRELSLAIRQRGALVGWLAAVRTAPGTAERLGLAPGTIVVEYPELYVDQEIWNTGAGIGAMMRAGDLQRERFGDDSVAIYITNAQTPQMVSLTRRRMASTAIRVILLKQRRKPIGEVV